MVDQEDKSFREIYTKEDVIEVLKMLHRTALEDCGALFCKNKSSEAVKLIDKVLVYAYNLENKHE